MRTRRPSLQEILILVPFVLAVGCGDDKNATPDGGKLPDKGVLADTSVTTDATAKSDTGVTADGGISDSTVADGGSAPAWSAVWTRLKTYTCDNGYCHGRGAGGLNLPATSASALIDQKATAACKSGTVLVVPGKPDESVLYLRLAGTDCGAQMPRTGDGASQNALNAADLKLVRDWIAGGAAQ